MEKNNLPKMITFMWFRTFGQMKTIQVKVTTLKKLLFISTIIVLATLISFIANIFLSLKLSEMKNLVSDLEKGIKNTEAICASFNDNNTNQTLDDETENSQEFTNTKTELQIKKQTIQEQVNVDQTTDSFIEISDVKKTLDFDKNRITIAFQLRHLKNENRSSISGYVILIGKNDDVAEPVYVTHPAKVKLNKEFPSDYRKGESFYIKNLKNVIGYLPLKKNNIQIKEIIIYVFSGVGEMLLEKPIPIGEDNVL